MFLEYYLIREEEELCDLIDLVEQQDLSVAAKQSLGDIAGKIKQLYGALRGTFKQMGQPYGLTAQQVQDRRNVDMGGSRNASDIESGQGMRQQFGGQAPPSEHDKRMKDPAYAYLNQMSSPSTNAPPSSVAGKYYGRKKPSMWNKMKNLFAHYDPNGEAVQMCREIAIMEQNVAQAMQQADISNQGTKLEYVKRLICDHSQRV
jgi:hypothetical protein